MDRLSFILGFFSDPPETQGEMRVSGWLAKAWIELQPWSTEFFDPAA